MKQSAADAETCPRHPQSILGDPLTGNSLPRASWKGPHCLPGTQKSVRICPATYLLALTAGPQAGPLAQHTAWPVPPEPWDGAAPGGRGSGGPRREGQAPPRGWPPYLASSAVPGPCLAVLTCWGQGASCPQPGNGWVRGGSGGQRPGSCSPHLRVCLLPRCCAVCGPVPGCPSMERSTCPGSLGVGGSLCSRKAFFLEAGILGFRPTRLQMPGRETMAQGQRQRGPEQDKTHPNACRHPPLGMVQAGGWEGPGTCALCGSRGRSPSQVSDGRPNELG